MIIDQLPLLGGDVQGTDEFPIERGTTTYKTTQAALIKTATDAAATAQAAADEANAKGLPPGGTAGQVLTKADSSDYSASWEDPSGGGDVTADMIGIVITGSRPSMVVTAGQYVIARGSTITGITDGLYINSSGGDLSPSTDVSAADLTPVSSGGLNDITQITAYTSNALTFGSGVTVSANYSTLYKYGKLCIVSANIGAIYDQTQSAGALIIATFANSVKPMNSTDILGVIEENGTIKNQVFTLRDSGEIAIYGENSTIYKNPKFFGVFICD